MKIFSQCVIGAVLILGSVTASYAGERSDFRSSRGHDNHQHDNHQHQDRGHHDRGAVIQYNFGGYYGYPFFVDPRFSYRYYGYPYYRDHQFHDPRYCRDRSHRHHHRDHRHHDRHQQR